MEEQVEPALTFSNTLFEMLTTVVEWKHLQTKPKVQKFETEEFQPIMCL